MAQTKSEQKSLIRQHARQIRQQISGQLAIEAAEALCHQLKSSLLYQSAKKVACYLSVDGEIDTCLLIKQILTDKGICFLPKLKPLKPNRLWFMPYQADTQLVNNRYNIPEVDLAVNNAIAVSRLDLILMPLVAFDLNGRRLGMGGGYYDATLAHLAGAKTNDKKLKPDYIGVAYQQQLVHQVPTENWDIKLDGVVTQQNYYTFEHN